MEIPRITLTMVGGTSTGKTMYMHGMYQRLSAGLHDYFLYTVDPDDEFDLINAWRMLTEVGTLPEPTSVQPCTYKFRFAQGMTPLLDFLWTDFRGGAALQKATAESADDDVTQLRKHVARTDSLYLVLDGRAIGKWVKKGCPAGPGGFDSGNMVLSIVNRQIRMALEGREQAGKPPPSIVVLITKMDLLAEASGRSTAETLRTAVAQLRNLLPLVHAPGVTALVCPVQIGDFGPREPTDGKIDVARIRPQNLHRPLVFSLWHYLTETLTADRQRLAGMRAELDAQSRELSTLQNTFFKLGKRQRIRDLESLTEQGRAEADAFGAAVHRDDSLADSLPEEFARLPVIRDGRLQLPAGRPE
ncbi:hypothetical protein ABZ686_21655 [Streptomyces sp. NPDC006992]|uniref:hypothetical protein n=1 Tax=unclassified Streptomyces TaxID=2593676 RepID=UPI0033E56EE5